MKRLHLFLAIVCAVQCASAQNVPLRNMSISVQPVLRIDGLLPSEVVGLSVQYEQMVSSHYAAAVRVTRFRDPLFKTARHGFDGFAFSAELRRYLTYEGTGWHVGPALEWVTYRFLGLDKAARGASNRHALDIGALVGYAWMIQQLHADVSARVSWFSPNDFPRAHFFPSDASQFTSHLIITLGYNLN